MHRTFIFILCITCILAGCLPAPYYQKEVFIPQNEWTYSFKPSFTFDITDTTTGYQPFFVIRHTQAYPYCNLWLWVYIKTPGDSTEKKERMNVVLADATGKWLGRGMGEIYEQRLPIKFDDSIRFNRAGTYKITFDQIMRINPIPEVLNVGLRMEKKGH